MPRGRPVKSQIRQNIIELLFYIGEGYGYDIYRFYKKLFPRVTMRSTYYHLNKGIELGEFKVNRVQKEQGSYSWGGEAEKTYYSLGSNAKPSADTRLKEQVDKILRERAAKSNH